MRWGADTPLRGMELTSRVTTHTLDPGVPPSPKDRARSNPRRDTVTEAGGLSPSTMRSGAGARRSPQITSGLYRHREKACEEIYLGTTRHPGAGRGPWRRSRDPELGHGMPMLEEPGVAESPGPGLPRIKSVGLAGKTGAGNVAYYNTWSNLDKLENPGSSRWRMALFDPWIAYYTLGSRKRFSIAWLRCRQPRELMRVKKPFFASGGRRIRFIAARGYGWRGGC